MSYVSWLTSMYSYTNAWLDKATKKGTWTKGDQEWFDATKRINPFIGMYEDRYKREQYMNRNNLYYSDVTQPWNLPGGSDFGTIVGYGMRRGLNYVSRNLERLYR